MHSPSLSWRWPLLRAPRHRNGISREVYLVADIWQFQHITAPHPWLIDADIESRAALSNATSTFLNGTASATRASNSSMASSLPTTVANATNTTVSCAAIGAPFLLQVSAPNTTSSANSSTNSTVSESLFNNWFVQVSGNGLLFTVKQSSASAFAVDTATGNLCAVGLVGDKGNPVAAVVETQAVNGTGVWLLDTTIAEALEPDYEAVTCASGAGTAGQSLACGWEDIQYWFGCGLQLDMSSAAGGSVTVGGLNCQSIQLVVVSS